MKVLELKDLNITAGTFRLTDINMALDYKDYGIILGPTGSGKTLLLQAIAGIKPPVKGRIYINGIDFTYKPMNKRRIGYVPQNPTLFPHLNVWENITFGLKYHKDAMDKIEIQDLLEMLGIYHLRHRTINGLSGGECQRIALARAIAIKPRIMLLDEVLRALDLKKRREIIDILIDINKRYNITVLHVTHSHEVAMALAKKIFVLMKGKIVQSGHISEVFNRPESIEVARFLGTANLLEGTARGYKVVVGKDTVICGQYIGYGRCRIAIRGEDIVLAKEAIRSSARNVIPVRVKSYRQHGSVICVNLKTEGGWLLNAIITPGSFDMLGIRKGARLYAIFKATSVHVIG